MKVLVIGSGGREHALVWKLLQSPEVSEIFALPGNGGISDLAQCIDMNVGNTPEIIDFSKRNKIDLVIVGPENPLASGIVDDFEKEGIPIFGPRKDGALIEASKVFSKVLMDGAGVPTAPFKVFADYEEARNYLETLTPPFVIKADGLCAGKGAYVIREMEEARTVLEELMVKAIYGEAGKRVVLEQFLPGVEASYLAFTDGKSILPMVPAQDHKPLLDGDKGPNTGGMGAYTPIPFINGLLEEEIKQNIMLKTLEGMRSKGITYKGVLYGGLMLSDGRPYVIEFNARLGDPETQPLLFRMKSDIVPIMMACVNENLNSIGEIKWHEGVSVCVVVAARGYPEKPEKGQEIKGLERLKGRDDVMVFHAGTKKVDGKYYTAGGRVLGVTAIGTTYNEAINKAYDAVSQIEFDGMYYRKDIGKKALLET